MLTIHLFLLLSPDADCCLVCGSAMPCTDIRTDVMYVCMYVCMVCMYGIMWLCIYIHRLPRMSKCNRASGISTKSAKAEGAEFESQGDLAGYSEPLSRLVFYPCLDCGKR